MLRVLHNANYEIIGHWKRMAILTIVWMLIGLGAMAVRGLTWSIDFTGGTMVQLEFTEAADAGRVRTAVASAGYPGAEIQQYGSPREYIVRAQPRTEAEDGEATTREIEQGLVREFGGSVSVVRSDYVSPRVGAELRQNAALALLISFVVTMIYLAFRFEWRFGLAAIISSLHDILVTLAFIALFRVEVSLTVVASILTVLGYSMNDTVIIFDRVRENLKKSSADFRTIINKSINETLPRSVLTHVTTGAATIALLVFGGRTIQPFALVMFFGVVVATFSSIFVAGAMLLWIERRWPPPSTRATRGTTRALAADRKRSASPAAVSTP